MNIYAVGLLAVVLIGLSGCGPKESVQKPASAGVVEPQTPLQAAAQRPAPARAPLPPAEPDLLEDSGLTVWAKNFKGQLIEGLDGNLYEPYGRPLIERVQKALGYRGLYKGPVNGVLDRPTMKSVFEFQKGSYVLQRCGVPTPNTRKMLEQGSHTDLKY